MHSLLRFLKEARQIHLRLVAGLLDSTAPPIYVVGNSSADLDSVISAIFYSYYVHQKIPTSSPRPHIPLLNLTGVPSGPELCRLRPEFVKALWISTSCPAIVETEKWDDTALESAGELIKEHIITVNDFAAHLKQHGRAGEQLSADMIMVDWNALPTRTELGKGTLTGLENVVFTVVGYIDHHIDEGFVPRPETLRAPELQPCPSLIESAGSCASLVVTWLHTTGLLQNPAAGHKSAFEVGRQLVRLALSPILIDTANLTAETKTTHRDITAVGILHAILNATDVDAAETVRNKIYNQICEAKQNSLDSLTVSEILDRDFKQWTEKTAQSGEDFKLGFCSIAKPIQWIVERVGGAEFFLDSLASFYGNRGLHIVVVMTAFNEDNQFYRELLIYTQDRTTAADMLENSFIPEAVSQLKLRDWSPPGSCGADKREVQEIRSTLNGDGQGPWRRVWMQLDVTKSRKQVAPLLRKVVGRC